MTVPITIKQGDFYYIVPQHEYSRYWLPHLEIIEQDRDYVQVENLPSDIPMVSKVAALKRGKGFKRYKKAMEQKGGGNHARYFKESIRD